MISGIWANDDLAAALRTMWKQGLSCSQIAAAINGRYGTKFTRNAIIGAVHRKMLPVRHKPPGLDPKKPRKPRRRRSPFKLWIPDMSEVPSPPPLSAPVGDQAIPFEQRKGIMELKDGDCRWPIGDPQKPGFFFCGAPAASPAPYCEAHCRRAYDRAFRVRRPFIPMLRASPLTT